MYKYPTGRSKYCKTLERAKRYILHHTINMDNPELFLSGFKRIPLKLIKDLQKLLPRPMLVVQFHVQKVTRIFVACSMYHHSKYSYSMSYIAYQIYPKKRIGKERQTKESRFDKNWLNNYNNFYALVENLKVYIINMGKYITYPRYNTYMHRFYFFSCIYKNTNLHKYS